MKRLLILLIAFIIACSTLKEAEKRYDTGDYDAVIAESRRAIAQDSTNADAWHLLSLALFKKGQLDSSFAAVSKAILISADSKEYQKTKFAVLASQGTELFGKAEFYKAIEKYEQALSLMPDSSSIKEKIGDAFFMAGKHEKAKETFASIKFIKDSTRMLDKILKIEQAQEFARAEFALGMKSLEKNKYEEAKKHFSKALEIKPDYKEASYRLYIATGLRYYQKGNVGALWDAIGQYGYAAVLYPERGEPHFLMGLAYHKKDGNEYEEAIGEFEKAVEVEPDGEYANQAKKKIKELKDHRKLMKEFLGE